MSELRVPLVVVEPLADGLPNLRAPLVVAEPLAEGLPNLRSPLVVAEPLSEGLPNIRVPLFVLEALQPVTEEGEMATAEFPIGLGLSWTTKKRPNFNTQVYTATSLKSSRNSLTPFPAWDFEVSFVWLLDMDSQPNIALGTTDLKYVEGFFLSMRGRHGAFLHRDPNDYIVIGGPMLRYTDQLVGGDGVTTEFWFSRTLAPFTEPVGQVDLTTRFSFLPGDVDTGANTIAEAAHGLATGAGPFFVSSTTGLPAGLAAATAYWVIAASSGTIKLALSRADALAGTAVDLTTAGTGVHTLAGGYAVYIDGVQQVAADFTFVAPNRIEFDSAPPDESVITADFRFFFVCHFLDDAADFESFAGNLWQLQQVGFRADPA